MDYIEIVDQDKKFLLNLEDVGFIDASREPVPVGQQGFKAELIIPSSVVSMRIPFKGTTEEEAISKRDEAYNKIYNCIYHKQKKIKQIVIE